MAAFQATKASTLGSVLIVPILVAALGLATPSAAEGQAVPRPAWPGEPAVPERLPRPPRWPGEPAGPAQLPRPPRPELSETQRRGVAIGAGIGFVGGIVWSIGEVFGGSCEEIECPARILIGPIVIAMGALAGALVGAATGLVVGTVVEILR